MRDLTQGQPLKVILAFGLPLYFGSLLQQAYILIDSIIVGQFLGGNELAALGISGPIVYLIVSMIIGLAVGFAIRIAQNKGAGNTDAISANIRSMFTLFLSFGCGILFISPLLAKLFIQLMNVPADIVDDTTVYATTLMYGLVFQFMVIAMTTALRALGDSVTPLYLLFATSIMNIALDIALIVYFDMGIFGAALATVISQFIGFVGIFAYVLKTNLYFKNVLQLKKSDFSDIGSTLKLGVFPACQHMMLSAGILVMIWILTPYGTAVIAAATIVGRLEMFVAMIFIEIGSANTTFVAQNMGKGNALRAKKGFQQSMILSAGFAALCSVLITCFPEVATNLFTQDADVTAVAVVYIQILFPFFILLALTNVMHGYLNGLGKTQVAFLCTLYSFIITRVPLTYLLGHYFGVVGFWWAGSIGWTVGFLYTALIATRVTINILNDRPIKAMAMTTEATSVT